MKRLLLMVAAVTVIVGFGPVPRASAQAPAKEMLIEYTQDGHRFVLRYDRTAGSLAISMPERSALGQEELKLLKAEVVRLTYGSGGRRDIPFGDSGYSLRFSGMYPVWAPYSVSAWPDSQKCLMFTEKARLDGRLFTAEGVDHQEAHRPYPIRPRPVTGVRMVK